MAGSVWPLRLRDDRLKQWGGLGGGCTMKMSQFENEPWCSSAACHSTVQFNCSSTLITDPPCCHTEANSCDYICKSPGEGSLSRNTTPVDAANDVILYQPHNCQERREISPHIVAALWPLRSPWTQHVPPWLSMSLWLALMIECFPCQTMHYSITLGMHLHSWNWFPHLSSSTRADILQLTIRS